MPHVIEPSTLRILKPTGETVGTGFLVSKTLAVTCAHVIKQLKCGAGDTIDICFTGKANSTTALVLPEFWRPDEATDIALLQVDKVPTGVFPLRMGRASESRLKNDLYTFGYAIAGGEQGIGGLGTFITLKQEGNFIQFRMHEANHGHSGAPIYDDKRGVVVGMIKKGTENLGRNAETTFAIPTETIWQVCPQLKPTISPLPRRNPIVDGINLLPYDYDQRIQNFLNEYLGTDSHPVPFGGRDDALKMLDTWLAETTSYLLLAAPAGRGKSALLVRWLDSLKAREDLSLAFVPVSIRFGTNMERVFFAALAARLAFLHGDDIPASPETSTAVYRGLVSDYLSKPLANGRTLLVVLDGLDEAADWQAGADFMPGELPAGVRVVVSARFLAGDADSTPWLRRLNWVRNGLASAPSLTPLDRAGVADVLLKMGCPLDELSRSVDIVKELRYLSEGDPLLVGLYVGDLWAKGDEVTHLKPEDLAGIQPGYKGYFDRWWEDQKKLWGKDKPWLEKHVRAVRNLLAGALGPLFRDDFQALDLELESDYIADALEVLQRFIIGDNQIQGYTFSHPKLGQYFWDSLTPAEQTQVEESFLAWGEQTLHEFIDGKRDPKKKTEVPVYAMRNYGAHLTQTNPPFERWLPLIHHQQWAQAWFTVEGAYGGYLKDVQRVWGACKALDGSLIEKIGKASHIDEQVRCGLIEASLHSLADNIPNYLIWPLVRDGIWIWPQVWAFIKQMLDSGKPGAVKAIASKLPKEQLPDALQVVSKTGNEYERASVLSILAQHLPEVADEALAIARVIKSESLRAEVLSNLLQYLPEVADEALKAAQAIPDEGEHAKALIRLASFLPEAVDEALETTLNIQDENLRIKALSNLMGYLSETHLFKMLDDTRVISDDLLQAEVLSGLVKYVPDGQLSWILEHALILSDDVSRAKVLGNLAQRIPEISDDALKIARTLLPNEKRVYALSIFAQSHPEIVSEVLDAATHAKSPVMMLKFLAQHLPKDRLGMVLRATKEINRELPRLYLLCALAQRLPEASIEALKTAQLINDVEERVVVLGGLAQFLTEAAEDAIEGVRCVTDETERVRILFALAQYLPEGYIEQLLDLTWGIQEEMVRAQILCVLIQRLPSKQLVRILEMPQEISKYSAWSHAQILIDLAQRLSDDVLGQVLDKARAIEEEDVRAEVLSSLVNRIPEELLVQVVEAAHEIYDESARAIVLSVLVQRTPEVAYEALATARVVKNEWSRAKAFNNLAQYLPVVVDEALNVALEIKDEEVSVRMLRNLAYHLPERELIRVLDIARAMVDTEDRISILSVLVQRWPELASETLQTTQLIDSEFLRAETLIILMQYMPELVGATLKAIQAINPPWSNIGMLRDLLRYLPKKELGQVLEDLLAVRDEDSRLRILNDLTQLMLNIPIKECYLHFEFLLGRLSYQKRENAFLDLASLMPVIIHLGTEDTPREIYEAVRDVTTWWP